MTVVIVILILVCTIVVVIEEWLTNTQSISVISSPSNPETNLSQENIDINKFNSLDQQQLQKPPSQSFANGQYLSKGINATGINIEKCWLKESVEIIKPCALCSIFELEINHSRYQANVHLCSKTGYKELVECSKTGPVERACQTNWRQFLTFLSIVNVLGGISGLLVRYRNYQLRCKSLSRFRKNTDPSDEATHTLINMEHTS